MTTGKALNGKPYAGNPHVAPLQRYGGTSRFDEGEVASAATPRRGSLLYKRIVPSAASKIWMVALVATTICVATALPSWAAEKIVTNTIDGVKWQLNFDNSKKNVCAGAVRGSGNTSANDYAAHRALVTYSSYNGKALLIPSSFEIDGTQYPTTIIGNRAFYKGRFSSVVVPENVVQLSWYAFIYCSNMKDVLLKGPATVMNGGTQSYKTLSCSNNEPIGRSSTAVKLVLVGPNVKIGGTTGNFKVSAATGVTALLPRSSGNTTWDAVTTSTIGGTNPTIVRYGPNEECGYDFWMGTDTITAVPRTLAALATVNGYASTFKTSFFLDTRYAVTNAIGTLTSDIYSGAGIDVKGEGELTFGLAAAFTGGVTASDSATVAVNAGCRPGNGAVTLSDTAMLKVAQSGTVTLGGALTAANGTSLVFNFTDAATAPTLVAATSATLPADGTVNVKVTTDDDFAKGTYTLVSGAGLTDGDLAKFSMNPKLSDDWRGTLSIADGNLILTVKPKPGMMMIVR